MVNNHFIIISLSKNKFNIMELILKNLKTFFLTMSLTLLSFSSISHADIYSGSDQPPTWGEWYLIRSEPDGYWITCTYKRKEIKDHSGGSIRTETTSMVTPRYPFGKCPDSITT